MAATATKNSKPTNRIAGVDTGTSIADIEVPVLFDLHRLRVKVVGVTPLLCANPSSMTSLNVATEGDKTTTKRGGSSADKETPASVCRAAAYFDADGNCAFPNVALFSCLLAAADLMKLKLEGVDDKGKKVRYPPSAAAVLQEGMSFDYKTKFVKLCDPQTMKPFVESDYEIDVQRAVNQNTGGAIAAIRPRFDSWAAVFDLLIDVENGNLMRILSEFMPTIFAFAGSSVGLGAFRAYVQPKGKGAKRRAGGPYGKFTAAIVE